MTAAYRTGIEITAQLQVGTALSSSIAGGTIRIDFLNDTYPRWHPAPDSFLGMLRLFHNLEGIDACLMFARVD